MLNRLASARLAAVLICILLALCLVSAFVPQKSYSDLNRLEAWKADHPTLALVASDLGLDDVFASLLFQAVAALLGLNLAVCTGRRIAERSRRDRRLELPDDAPYETVPWSPLRVEAELKSRHRLWRVSRSESNERVLLVFDREGLGFFGSMVLHAGLLLVIAGALISGVTRFEGRMVLAEGESRPDEPASYVSSPREPLVGEAFHPFGVRLDSLRFDYEGRHLKQSYADLTFLEADRSASSVARADAPARWRDKSFALSKSGHAVLIIAEDQLRHEVVLYPHSIVRLNDPVEGGFADEIEFKDGRRLKILSQADGSSVARSARHTMALTDPVVRFTLEGAHSILLRPGHSGTVGDAVVTLEDVSMWTELVVREDHGVPVIFFGFGSVLLGAALRMYFGRDRAVLCSVEPAEKGGARISIWSREAVDRDRAMSVFDDTAPYQLN